VRIDSTDAMGPGADTLAERASSAASETLNELLLPLVELLATRRKLVRSTPPLPSIFMGKVPLRRVTFAPHG
jgi:hypothetical protein